ncbi:MAG TPA: DinB family protein [Pyrinomonadaceae bacterium]|jgi:uncharacterized damage-inducible protein DinB|nr:DinB family protein [Pyrinomonadaceae bacterium]
MKLIDSLRAEFDHEAQTTRKYFERLPDDKLDWRPHEKSFTVAGLAGHIVEFTGWTVPILNEDGIDFDPKTYQPYTPLSVADLLNTFDDNVAKSKQALADASEETIELPWSIKIMGSVIFERPKATTFRDIALSHVIHHRGQLSVYLRLLGVAVPGAYGPTADEPEMEDIPQ